MAIAYMRKDSDYKLMVKDCRQTDYNRPVPYTEVESGEPGRHVKTPKFKITLLFYNGHYNVSISLL